MVTVELFAAPNVDMEKASLRTLSDIAEELELESTLLYQERYQTSKALLFHTISFLWLSKC